MKNYRLSYNGMGGFDYKGFETQQEAIDYAMEQAKLGLMTPLKIYKYNSKKDEYREIIEFKKVS